MLRTTLSVLAALAAFSGPIAAQAPLIAPPDRGAPAPLLLNERAPLPGVLTGGSNRAPEEFDALAAAGYITYVDLRSDSELAPDVRERAESAGLAYLRIPVSGEAELDLVSVRALDAVLDDDARYPVVVACGSGNRSGALLALRDHWLDSEPAEESLALGLNAGLTRLEPAVRALLGLRPAPAPQPAPGTVRPLSGSSGAEGTVEGSPPRKEERHGR
jgi:protein tyrosine phosphatase (PTP) superfamily phosphohydrolase (DUF442 family)